MGTVSRVMESHETAIRRGHVEVHRDQAIVERFNRTLAWRLFGHQYAVEMRLPEGQRSVVWVGRLPDVVSALNQQVTRLIGRKPKEALKEKTVFAAPVTSYFRPVGKAEKTLPPDVKIRYLYQPGELESGTRRATDPVWSLKTFPLGRAMIKPSQAAMYWLGPAENGDGDPPKRSFVREELMVIPPHTELPPTKPG